MIYGQMGSGCTWLICEVCDFPGPVTQWWLDYDEAARLWDLNLKMIFLALGQVLDK